MNESTQKIIEELSQKLGVATERVWECLIRQAPISSACDIAASAVVVTALVCIGVVIRRKTKNCDSFDFLAVCLIWAMFFMVCLIVSLVIFGNLGTILSGLFNPEYWALMQILK